MRLETKCPAKERSRGTSALALNALSSWKKSYVPNFTLSRKTKTWLVMTVSVESITVVRNCWPPAQRGLYTNVNDLHWN
jgi:hypothetical protein